MVCNMGVISDLTMVVAQPSVQAADEPRCLCIIRDMTNVDCPVKTTMNMPASTLCSSLLLDVARYFSYPSDTITLLYDQIEVDNVNPTMTVGELCPIANKKNEFVLFATSAKGNLLVEGSNTTSLVENEDENTQTSRLLTHASSTPAQIGSDIVFDNNMPPFAAGPSNVDDSSVPPLCDAGTDRSASTTTYGSYSYAQAVAFKPSETGFVGLVNQAMTCYLNSLLQTLYMTPEFRNAVYRWEYDGTEEEAVKSIPFQLQRLFLLLQTSKKRAIETTDITKSFGWDSSDAWQQHDVQELCRVMFDALERKWRHTDQSDLINQLYQGKMKDYVKCLACGNESARTDTYLDIPLVVRPFGATNSYGSVEEALRAFVEPEILNGTNQYFCEKCGTKSDAHKGLKFTSFPYILTLQLKRFDFDYSNMQRIKLNDRMTFPDVLDLSFLMDGGAWEDEMDGMTKNKSKNGDCTTIDVDVDEGVDEGIDIVYTASGHSTESTIDINGSESNASVSDISESVDTAIGESNRAAHFNETNRTTRNESDSAAQLNESDRTAQLNESNISKTGAAAVQSGCEYELLSIMVHSGGAGGGHYFAYIKNFRDNQWYSFNDQHVSRLNQSDIEKTYGSNPVSYGYYSPYSSSSANAYMLIYRKKDAVRNKDFMEEADFPRHLQCQLKQLEMREQEEHRLRELDKNTCKIRLFFYEKTTEKYMEMKLEVYKDLTLAQVTEIAWKQLHLTNKPLSSVRLVKYDNQADYIDRSYEDEMDRPIHEVLGGVRSVYTFDLLMEVKSTADEEFIVYTPGGITVKIYVVDLTEDMVNNPIPLRVYHDQTVGQFKSCVASFLKTTTDRLCCVLEKSFRVLHRLSMDYASLHAEGFYKGSKVYVECSGAADRYSTLAFQDTPLYELLDRYQNTVHICMTLPSLNKVSMYTATYRDDFCAPSSPAATTSRHASLASVPFNSHRPTSSSPSWDKTMDETGECIRVTRVSSTDRSHLADEASNNDIDEGIAESEPSENSVGEYDTVPVRDTEPIPVVNCRPRRQPQIGAASVTASGDGSFPDNSPVPSSTDEVDMDKTLVLDGLRFSARTDSAGSAATVTRSVNFSESTVDNSCDGDASTQRCRRKSFEFPPSTNGQNSSAAELDVFDYSDTRPPISSLLTTTTTQSDTDETGCGALHSSLTVGGDAELRIRVADYIGSVVHGELAEDEMPLIVSEGITGAPEFDSSPISVTPSRALSQDSGSSLTATAGDPEQYDDDIRTPPQISPQVSSDGEQEGVVVEGLESSSVRNYAGIGDREWGVAERGGALDLLEDSEGGDAVVDGTRGCAVGKEGGEEEEFPVVREVERYFSARWNDEPITKFSGRSLLVDVDKRITLERLKDQLQPYVGVPSQHFKVYRLDRPNQSSDETEETRLTESLYNFTDETKLEIKLGRALKSGEFRVQVFQLRVNNPEPIRFLVEVIVVRGMTILDCKRIVLKELRAQCMMEIAIERCRLRRKNYKSPGMIYTDEQQFGEEIVILSEILVEILEDDEPIRGHRWPNQSSSMISLYIRRWWPSKYQIDPLQELVLEDYSVETLATRLSELSGIVRNNISFAKARLTFPCDLSVLEVEKTLDWDASVTTINQWPMSVHEDGDVIYYKDRTEEMMQMSDDEKDELTKLENARLRKQPIALPKYVPRKEKALKIYTDDTYPLPALSPSQDVSRDKF